MNDGKREISEKQRAVLDRARATAIRNRRRKTDAAIWERIEPKIIQHNCHCGLRYGMQHGDLRKLGAGCTDPRWCCPVLDTYRRYLEDPSSMGVKL
jgi:hypothetical protein